MEGEQSLKDLQVLLSYATYDKLDVVSGRLNRQMQYSTVYTVGNRQMLSCKKIENGVTNMDYKYCTVTTIR